MSEFILCLARNNIPERFLAPKVSVKMQWEEISTVFKDGHCGFFERRKAEEDPSYKQLIPYVVVRNIRGDVLTYKRAGSEARLHAQLSLGIGGHVNNTDVGDADFQVERTIRRGISRELAEELGIEQQLGSVRFLGLINEELSEVGKVHLGLVYEYCLSSHESVSPGQELYQPYWSSLARIMSQKENFELWSQIVLGFLEDS